MTTPRTVSILCPFGDDCPNTLTATIQPGSPPILSGPPDNWYPGDPPMIEDVKGCPEHVTLNNEEEQRLDTLLFDQLAQDDLDARDRYHDARIDEALGK